MKRVKAAVLGATGMVGQLYVELLAKNPWFEISAVTGKSNVGKTLAEAYRGRGNTPEIYKDLEVLPSDPGRIDADIVFSCLPTSAAREVEPRFAEAGFPVISDASAHRTWPDVPLIVPEINPEHLDLIDVQRKNRKWDGFIVTTPNCTTVGFVMPLKALMDQFGLKYASLVSMQAISGAGYNGVPSMAILGNIIPYIEGEEPKVIEEPRKILGKLNDGKIIPAEIAIDATCTRSPTIFGHLEVIQVELNEDAEIDEVKETLSTYSGLPQMLELPSAPRRPIYVFEEPDRPQPRLDVDFGDVKGMTITIGRLRKSSRPRHYSFVSLSHNLIRGAAGTAILTAELLIATRRLNY
ncbi:MAG: aspartate-semialdehyde dehydrogenase [Nitrososphaerota archaeon]